MNTQNLRTLSLTAEQLSVIDAAFDTMKANLVGLVALNPVEKQGGRAMGTRTEPFCRLALETMQKHPQLVPARIPVADTLARLKTYDDLRPRVRNLIELLTRADDTLFSMGSDIYAVALEGYQQLRRLGQTDGLKQTIDELRLRFAKTSAKAKARRAGTPGGATDTGAQATA